MKKTPLVFEKVNAGIPKKILRAEKMLKCAYPEVYPLVQRYRYSKYIAWHEYEKIKFRIERMVNYELIKDTILSFIGIKKEPTLGNEIETEEDEKSNCKKEEKDCTLI